MIKLTNILNFAESVNVLTFKFQLPQEQGIICIFELGVTLDSGDKIV